MSFFKSFGLAVAACFFVQTAQADTLLSIEDDGNGFARFVLTGTYDNSDGGLSIPFFDPITHVTVGRTARVGGNGVPSTTVGMAILDVPAPVSSTITRSFTQVSGPGFFVNSTDEENFTDTNIDIVDNVLLSFLQQNFFGGFVFSNVSIITDAAGPRSGTFNEDFVTNISFSIFNQGTWDFASGFSTANQGAFGGTPNDALRLAIGQGLPAPVPLPSTGFLLIAGLAAVGAARRYGRSRQN